MRDKNYFLTSAVSQTILIESHLIESHFTVSQHVESTVVVSVAFEQAAKKPIITNANNTFFIFFNLYKIIHKYCVNVNTTIIIRI
jgi:hypothetical protein